MNDNAFSNARAHLSRSCGPVLLHTVSLLALSCASHDISPEPESIAVDPQAIRAGDHRDRPPHGRPPGWPPGRGPHPHQGGCAGSTDAGSAGTAGAAAGSGGTSGGDSGGTGGADPGSCTVVELIQDGGFDDPSAWTEIARGVPHQILRDSAAYFSSEERQQSPTRHVFQEVYQNIFIPEDTTELTMVYTGPINYERLDVRLGDAPFGFGLSFVGNPGTLGSGFDYSTIAGTEQRFSIAFFQASLPPENIWIYDVSVQATVCGQ